MDFKPWLEEFCETVFPKQRQRQAFDVVRGGVDGFWARHGGPRDDAEHRRWLEQGIWFAHDTKLLDADMGLEDKRVAILERLEKLHGKA